MNLIKIKTSSNLLNYWNFGSLISMTMMTQILMGIMLSMNYMIKSNMFNSSMNIYFNMNYGWLMRIMHSNMTSIIFILMLIHIKRSLYYKSMFNKMMWMSGMSMMLMIMIESFVGYSLIWNQMSYWAMMVITNFLSSIPKIGNNMVSWVWGNFNINKILINRFFTIHFIIPMLIMLMIMIHLLMLHMVKSNNPLGINNKMDLMNLNPLQLIKDMIFLIIIMMVFTNINMFNPFYFNNNDNFIMMNYFKTPPHIEPEWYFMFFFSILRSINNKFNGMMMLIMSIMMMFMLPIMNSNQLQYFFFMNNMLMTILLTTMLTISIMGMKNPEYPYLNINILLINNYFMIYITMYIVNKMFKMKF